MGCANCVSIKHANCMAGNTCRLVLSNNMAWYTVRHVHWIWSRCTSFGRRKLVKAVLQFSDNWELVYGKEISVEYYSVSELKEWDFVIVPVRGNKCNRHIVNWYKIYPAKTHICYSDHTFHVSYLRVYRHSHKWSRDKRFLHLRADPRTCHQGTESLILRAALYLVYLRISWVSQNMSQVFGVQYLKYVRPNRVCKASGKHAC